MRVAIVGTGVSGLVAARELYGQHEITVFESEQRIGGHVQTWSFESAGRQWNIDSGFIVYNERNYPEFTRLLKELKVETQPSTMSFSVRHDDAGIEYNGSSLRQLFVSYQNAVRPRFLRMLIDVIRFNKRAPSMLLAGPVDETLEALLLRGRFSKSFRDWYLLPMGSAIWSVPFDTVLKMPASFFIAFFSNHGMLSINDRPEWRVVRGGSNSYVDVLVAPFRDRIRTNRQVRRVVRTEDGVEVDGERFDRVVIACHSDQALNLLADPSDEEKELLGAMPYQSNDAVVHTDTSVLPQNNDAWAAWNYRVAKGSGAPALVTYNMNILQSLGAAETFCVTLNDPGTIDPNLILAKTSYSHPVYSTGGIRARERRHIISGPNNTHYCGAYWGNGFHEDGVVSGLAAAGEVAAAHKSASR